jgi:formylglycine-generating enzyme required for sulfatase activity
MQKTEVTQGQWKAVMGNNPSYFKDCGYDCPVENVSWDDVQEFINKLNELDKEGNKYRLPKEAEWEYAARAGSIGRYYFGDDESLLSEYAWYKKNSGMRTHPVATKKPNDWGLYDMHGNVSEWTQNWFDDYHTDSVIDPPVSSESGLDIVIRGGRWKDDAIYCRSANRDGGKPDHHYDVVGFRVVLYFIK